MTNRTPIDATKLSAIRVDLGEKNTKFLGFDIPEPGDPIFELWEFNAG